MNRTYVPAVFGMPAERRGALSITSGVNFIARRTIWVTFSNVRRYNMRARGVVGLATLFESTRQGPCSAEDGSSHKLIADAAPNRQDYSRYLRHITQRGLARAQSSTLNYLAKHGNRILTFRLRFERGPLATARVALRPKLLHEI